MLFFHIFRQYPPTNYVLDRLFKNCNKFESVLCSFFPFFSEIGHKYGPVKTAELDRLQANTRARDIFETGRTDTPSGQRQINVVACF